MTPRTKKDFADENIKEEASEETVEETPVKPVRKQKIPKLNDNPDAPEVVDAPRLIEANKHNSSENGVNGADSDLDTSGDKTSSEMPLISGEEENNTSVSNDNDAGAADNLANNNKSSKSDPIVLIPLSDESFEEKAKNGSAASDREDSEVTKDETIGPSDSEGDLLTKMIRDNLNKAVNEGVDDMKESLYNAIKNTLNSSNTKPKSDDESVKDSSSDKEEEVKKEEESEELKKDDSSNGVMVNGDADHTDTKPELDTIDTTGDNNKGEDVPQSQEEIKDDLIEAATVEISSAAVVVDQDLSVSGDGIADLVVESNNDASDNSATNEASKESSEKTEDSGVTITLDQLDQGMLPVESVQIEHIEADGAAPDLEKLEIVEMDQSNISVVVAEEVTEKPKLNIDKTKLFSQMNDIFAKDTHKALKNRPVYQKRKQASSSPGEESEESKPQSPPAKKKKVKGKKGKEDKSVIEEDEDKKEDKESDMDVDEGPPVLDKIEEEKTEEDSEETVKEEEKEDEEKPLPDLTPEDDKVPEDVNEEVNNEEEQQSKPETSTEDPDDKLETENCDNKAEPAEDEEEESKVDTEDDSPEPPVLSAEVPPSDQEQSSSSNSELTKSLRKVRLSKKSPSKTPNKDKSWEEDQSEEESVNNRSKSSSSPVKDSASQLPKAGTEVFDFTDEEDLPLSNIDLDVLDAANTNGDSLQISIPEEPQPTLDHELSHLTPKTSPAKSKMRFEVSPQILSVSDAVAAVAALQVSPKQMKMNGEAALSDDTDNSVNAHNKGQGKVAKRKKRRVTESDEGERIIIITNIFKLM